VLVAFYLTFSVKYATINNMRKRKKQALESARTTPEGVMRQWLNERKSEYVPYDYRPIGSFAVEAAMFDLATQLGVNDDRQGSDPDVSLHVRMARDMANDDSGRLWPNLSNIVRQGNQKEYGKGVEKLLGPEAVKLYQKGFLGAQLGPLENVANVLTEKDKAGDYKIDENLALNYFQFTDHYYDKRQKELDQQMPEFINLFVKRLEKAKQAGWIKDEFIPESIVKLIKNVRFFINDGPMTTFEKSDGLHDREFGHIYLSPRSVEQFLDNRERGIVFHELVHKLASLNYSGGLAKIGMIGSVGPNTATSLNEALTEIITAAFMPEGISFREHDIFNKDHYAKPFTYKAERFLVDAMIQNPKHDLDLHDFLDAYFEPAIVNLEEGTVAAGPKVRYLGQKLSSGKIAKALQKVERLDQKSPRYASNLIKIGKSLMR
jgi:hypothetical protein